MKITFFVRRFSNLIILTFLLILPGSNLFGQNNSAFGTLAASSPKNKPTEPTRPRLVSDLKTNPNETDPKTFPKTENQLNPKPNSNLIQNPELSAKLEQKVFEILNQKRKEKGLSPLIWREDMAKIARIHSNNMAELNFFSHFGKDGLMVSDRADANGVSNWRAIGENIAYNQGFENPAEFACERWMLSQGHRDNILNKQWLETGVGVAMTDEGKYYFTQVFVLR